MEWLTTAQQILALATGLVGLIGTGIGAFFAIRNFIKLCKEKSAKEIWAMIVSSADAAMKEVEKSELDGSSKKELVINTVKAACKEAGVDITEFLEQLNSYIDQTISFVNEMKK